MRLVDFLTARLDEDEAVAERLRSSSVGDPWGWQPNRLETCEKRRVDYPPARVLADVKAKRAIVDRHSEVYYGAHEGVGSVTMCRECRDQRGPCWTLRNLASVYADHPDYDATWAP
jgi:hypothetical protein